MRRVGIGAIVASGDPVHVEVNGERRAVSDDATIVALLELLGLGTTLVAVERNGEIVPRARHASTQLRDGDRLEVVHFVGGG
jgi:sulfur carrier protein